MPIYFSPRQLKKAYYREALATHPDVNKSDSNSNKKFQKVAEAYQLLSKSKTSKTNIETDCTDTYDTFSKNKPEFFKNLIKNITGCELNSDTLKHIISVMTTKCIYAWKKMLDTIDNDTLSFLIKLISKHNDIFNIDRSLVQELYHVARERKHTKCYILKPNLDHLLEPEFFILKHESSVFYIPLWEHELIYKTKSGNIHVKCCPDLPKHMMIDKHNVLHVNVTIHNDKLTTKELKIPVGKSILTLPTEKIKNKKYTHIFSGIGIPNTSDFTSTHDIIDSKRSDIKIHVQIK